MRSLLCLALVGIATVASADDRPNIIVIMSDDMGYSDLGCYGGEIATPTLDKLAENGLRFTQFYNTARCCPTRACLLTGLYPHQAGVGHMMEDRKLPGYRGELNKECRTMAEVLKPAGYGTYAIGKWHVTPDTQPNGPKDTWPLQRGFDHFYGTIHGGGSYYDPSSLVRNNTMISPYADPEYKPKTFYYTDAISDHVVKFIDQHESQKTEKPFFMYVTYTSAHWPMHALPEDIAKYKGKYDVGYEPVRQARFKKMQTMGLIDPKWELSEQAGKWDSVKNKEWESRCMEVYAAMVDRMDQGIGKIVAELEKTGQLDNTLILFMQDNGACAENMGRTGNKQHPNILKPEKPTLPPRADDFLLHNGSVPDQTRDGYPVRMGDKVMPGAADTYVAYGEGWANVSNTPFREYKHWVHEGGIGTPLIAHWPKGISAKGELRTTPSHLIDIAATCADVGQAKYPKEVGGQAITPLQGKSLVPVFKNDTLERDAIYWEHEGNRAIRIGDMKLVAKGPKGKWELYDLKADRTEQHDLAASQTETVDKMARQWTKWAKQSKVLPWPWK